MKCTGDRRQFLRLVGTIGVASIAGCTGSPETSPEAIDDATREFMMDSTLYASPTCGCCEAYATYVKKREIPLQVQKTRDLSTIKTDLGIPRDLWSCHTVDMGQYIVEGHVPLAAIEKLVEEQPQVAGIALPEMPNGSPGMGGSKQGAFTIYAFDAGGQYHEFTTV